MTGTFEPTNDQLPPSVASLPQLVRALMHWHCEVTGSNPIEVLKFSCFSKAIAKIAFITARIIASLDSSIKV